MKKFIGLVIGVLLSQMAQAQSSSMVLLQMDTLVDASTVLQSVAVSSDGSVTIYRNGISQVIEVLDQGEIANIENEIGVIQEGSLIRTVPGQAFTPGALVTEYYLWDSSGYQFTFAKNLRGVDFGLPYSQGQDLVCLLQSLARD